MTRPVPGRMRLVPEVADTAMQHAGADAIDWQDEDKSPQKIFRLGWPAMLDAAPNAGLVSREMVEWVARALFKEQRQEAVRAGAVFYSETFNWRVCLSEARVAIAALGLTVAPAADTAREREGG